MTKRVIGLIGGIASGKSVASQYFKEMKIDVIDADEIAREIVKPGEALLQTIATHFGAEALDQEGRLNRAYLRERVFADPHERLWLEALMHPLIRARIDAMIEGSHSPYCVVAIPLLKRREDYPKITHILVLDVPPDLQIKRLVARDQISPELALSIIESQPSREQRLALADEVIVNDGTTTDLHQKLKMCKLLK